MKRLVVSHLEVMIMDSVTKEITSRLETEGFDLSKVIDQKIDRVKNRTIFTQED